LLLVEVAVHEIIRIKLLPFIGAYVLHCIVYEMAKRARMQCQSIAKVISFTKMYGFISLGCIIKELQYFKVLMLFCIKLVKILGTQRYIGLGSQGVGVKPESFSWYHPDDPICVYIIRPNFTSILQMFALLFDWNVLGLTNLDIGFVY
jgi:hypothetical protein